MLNRSVLFFSILLLSGLYYSTLEAGPVADNSLVIVGRYNIDLPPGLELLNEREIAKQRIKDEQLLLDNEIKNAQPIQLCFTKKPLITPIKDNGIKPLQF